MVLLVFGFLGPQLSFANGGDQRVLGREYLINLSRSPFTPIAGTKSAMTVSFVDLLTGRPIQEDIFVTVRVGKGRGSKTFIHEEKSIPVTGGILDWSYVFDDTGIHELFFSFAFTAEPNVMYEPPDFLLDVQKAEEAERNTSIAVVLIAALLGATCGFMIRRKN
jgi:hypothetical protein